MNQYIYFHGNKQIWQKLKKNIGYSSIFNKPELIKASRNRLFFDLIVRCLNWWSLKVYFKLSVKELRQVLPRFAVLNAQSVSGSKTKVTILAYCVYLDISCFLFAIRIDSTELCNQILCLLNWINHTWITMLFPGNFGLCHLGAARMSCCKAIVTLVLKLSIMAWISKEIYIHTPCIVPIHLNSNVESQYES